MFRDNELNEGWTGTLSEKTAGKDCRLLRRKLAALRENRAALKEERSGEIERLESVFQSTKERLARRLLERTHNAAYRQHLRHYHEERPVEDQQPGGDPTPTTRGIGYRGAGGGVPVSNYVVKHETPLLSALHRSFLVLPNQIEVCEGEYERNLYPFFRDEIQALHIESLETLDRWMRRLSAQAEKNEALYESYRKECETKEEEINKLKIRLQQQQRDGKYCDDESIASGTECSSDSDSEISPGREAGVGFLKLLFTPTQKIERERSHPKVSCGGPDVQIATRRKFRLPFGQRNDDTKIK